MYIDERKLLILVCNLKKAIASIENVTTDITNLQERVDAIEADIDTINGLIAAINVILEKRTLILHTASSTGLLTSFIVPHSLGVVPAHVFVTPYTDDAQGFTSVTRNINDITINYSVAPPVGSDNLLFGVEIIAP